MNKIQFWLITIFLSGSAHVYTFKFSYHFGRSKLFEKQIEKLELKVETDKWLLNYFVNTTCKNVNVLRFHSFILLFRRHFSARQKFLLKFINESCSVLMSLDKVIQRNHKSF